MSHGNEICPLARSLSRDPPPLAGEGDRRKAVEGGAACSIASHRSGEVCASGSPLLRPLAGILPRKRWRKTTAPSRLRSHDESSRHFPMNFAPHPPDFVVRLRSSFVSKFAFPFRPLSEISFCLSPRFHALVEYMHQPHATGSATNVCGETAGRRRGVVPNRWAKRTEANLGGTGSPPLPTRGTMPENPVPRDALRLVLNCSETLDVPGPVL